MSDLLNSASLVLIPSGYAEDKVYSAVPTDGSGDMNFTRSSNGTRINSAGLVEVCPWNLATNSENFSSWNLANVTVTTNDITAPNGTLTADKLTISNNANDVKQTISVMPNSVYTWTFYVYGGTALGQQMRFYDNTNSANIEYYNYSSSVVLGAWVKIERTFTTPSGCYEIQAWVLAATSTIGTMWAWGAQLNIGSTAKPYFPTTDRLNVPRLTYQNGGGGCPSLLLEKQSTNLVTYSEQFDNAAFANDGVYSITANATTSPDGTQNADLFTSTVNALSYIYQNLTITNGATYTVSVFAKAGSTNFLELDAINNIRGVIFNLSNGTISSTINGTGAIESVGNGWYKCSVTRTATSVNGIFLAMPPTNGSSVNAAIGNSIYLWGAQLEQSTYPTSYIPTTSASATRVADACSKTGISSLIGQTEGTMFVDVAEESPNEDGRYMFISDASFTNRIVIYQASGSINVYCSAGGGFNLTYSPPAGRLKIAFVYKSNDYALWVNGVVRTATVVSAVPSGLNAMGISSNEGSIGTPQPLDTSVNQAVLFKTRLTNSELASLTTL
jgi:hypothetical protein